MEAVRRWAPAVWAVGLAGLMLGPALAPGYVLTYDMVWVPDLALRPDFLGLGSALPRAVPSDAVVSVLDEVVPGALLQKVVLVAGLAGGGIGIDRWLPGARVPARLAAVTFYVWNPYVIERLLIGHWPVLLAYAAAPWVALFARRARAEALPLGLLVLVPVGSLSASAGLITAAVVIAFGLARRSAGALVALVAAANAPWVVAGLLHAGAATSDPDAAGLFALQGEGRLPAPLAALGLGGIWNSEVVPTTRVGVLGAVSLVTLCALAAFGSRRWRAATDQRDQAAAAVCWVLGWGLAVLTWLLPDGFGWLASEVPGGGLLRDGTRFLGLCALVVAPLVGHGVDHLCGWIEGRTRERAQALFIATMLALLPVALMPDAAWGGSGRLRAVSYPAGYDAAAAAVPDDSRVLLLPFTSYRAPEWNHGRKVLDPLARFLDPDVVVNDDLVVSGQAISGEDPLAEDVQRALRSRSPRARAQALAGLGIGTVVSERAAPGATPAVAGSVLETGDYRVTALDDVREDPPSMGWRAAMTVAWLAFVAPLGWTVAALGGRLRRRRRTGIA